jgi:hypothetical protein
MDRNNDGRLGPRERHARKGSGGARRPMGGGRRPR